MMSSWPYIHMLVIWSQPSSRIPKYHELLKPKRRICIHWLLMVIVIQIATLGMYFSASSNLSSVIMTYTTGFNHTTIIQVLIGPFRLFYSFDLGVTEQNSEAVNRASEV